jgi:hypothetical protein
MKSHKTVVNLFAVLLASTLASGMAAEEPSAGITIEEAKSLVAQISDVAAEFRRNSACKIETLSPASEVACHFYMLHAACAPAKGGPGISRDLAVSKANGDIEPIDRPGNLRVTEPAVLRSQQAILAAHGISEQAAAVPRNVSREGCMYR